MELYLARHGHVDYPNSIDPIAAGLTELGQQQSRDIAAMCERLGIRFVIASTMIRAEETANMVSEALPETNRWDLEELQEAVYEDLMYDPSAHPSMDHWSDEQLMTSRKRTWIRVTAVLPRIEIYMASYGYERALIVAHEDILRMMLLAWQEKDWRVLDEFDHLDFGSISKVELNGKATKIGPINASPAQF